MEERKLIYLKRQTGCNRRWTHERRPTWASEPWRRSASVAQSHGWAYRKRHKIYRHNTQSRDRDENEQLEAFSLCWPVTDYRYGSFTEQFKLGFCNSASRSQAVERFYFATLRAINEDPSWPDELVWRKSWEGATRWAQRSYGSRTQARLGKQNGREPLKKAKWQREG